MEHTNFLSSLVKVKHHERMPPDSPAVSRNEASVAGHDGEPLIVQAAADALQNAIQERAIQRSRRQRTNSIRPGQLILSHGNSSLVLPQLSTLLSGARISPAAKQQVNSEGQRVPSNRLGVSRSNTPQFKNKKKVKLTDSGELKIQRKDSSLGMSGDSIPALPLMPTNGREPEGDALGYSKAFSRSSNPPPANTSIVRMSIPNTTHHESEQT